ncbi:TPA: hypothetical protein ACXJLS_000014 [Stenotrophomonas maltophilia]
MNSSIILLTDLSYEIGLIGVAEYIERMKTEEWLSELGDGVRDPRLNSGEEAQCCERKEPVKQQKTGYDARSRDSLEEVNDESPYMQFMALNTWMFTVGDRDCYPSVPHGHFKRKTNEWPKLNPYVGRVFSAMHTEDVSARLTRGGNESPMERRRFCGPLPEPSVVVQRLRSSLYLPQCSQRKARLSKMALEMPSYSSKSTPLRGAD